ncbi:MAG: hypothetical protein OXI44_01265 [Bacteroidota bacterium]|nr:hypothetical protein [Bacteroidota bacterium]
MKQKYIDALGRGDGEMLHKVVDEWSYVLLRYQEFMELFGKDAKRVALLNALSPAFTHDLQVQLSNALILGLCRLTDKDPRSVSVCHLPRFIRDNTDLRAEVDCHVARAQTYAEAGRVRRNKWIAHRDKVRTDITVLYKDIKAGLDAVHAALNAVAMDYWEHFIPNKVTSLQMPSARFVASLESLVEGVMYIESRIDPTGESGPFDDEVSKAFLRRIGGDPSADLVKLRRLRAAVKTIKEGLD